MRDGDALIGCSRFCCNHCSPTLTDRQRGFTIGGLLGPETGVEGVQPWLPGLLGATETWTGLQAWYRCSEWICQKLLGADWLSGLGLPGPGPELELDLGR